jgi:hypothetical protein
MHNGFLMLFNEVADEWEPHYFVLWPNKMIYSKSREDDAASDEVCSKHKQEGGKERGYQPGN